MLHTPDEDRALTSTWLMDEVRFRGKGVKDTRDIWGMWVPGEQINPETGEGGVFVDYIKKFLKLKAEACGYPGWVHSREDEDRYV